MLTSLEEGCGPTLEEYLRAAKNYYHSHENQYKLCVFQMHVLS